MALFRESTVHATWFRASPFVWQGHPATSRIGPKAWNRADTEGATVVVSPAGKFHVRFDLHNTKYQRGRTSLSIRLGVG